jgi:hypothetical protein
MPLAASMARLVAPSANLPPRRPGLVATIGPERHGPPRSATHMHPLARTETGASVPAIYQSRSYAPASGLPNSGWSWPVRGQRAAASALCRTGLENFMAPSSMPLIFSVR